MSEVPKIVRDRLRASVAGEGHPDADVLTAFAEQALPGTEREGVIRHLSRCADCREVVAFSIPPKETAAQPTAPRQGAPAAAGTSGGWRGWFAWPNLRWAAMAAAVVVVGSVLALRPGKHPPSMVETANQQAEKNTPSTDASAKAPTSLADKAEPTVASPAKPDTSLTREARTSRRIEPLSGRVQRQLSSGAAATLADNKRADSFEGKPSYSFEAGRMAAVPAAPPASAKAGIAPSERSEKKQVTGSAHETVEVNGAAEVVQSTPVEDMLTSRNAAAPPVEKAKLPQKNEEVQLEAQAQNSEAPNKLASAYSTSEPTAALRKQRLKESKDVTAQWSLAQGKLQRSLDAGATWQIALQLEHPLLSFGARGSDVWAGSQAGRLFHSTDSGATWTMVQPSTKSGSLSSDIVAIEIRSPSEIVLSTSNNESWTTVDAGKTWDKK